MTTIYFHMTAFWQRPSLYFPFIMEKAREKRREQLRHRFSTSTFTFRRLLVLLDPSLEVCLFGCMTLGVYDSRLLDHGSCIEVPKLIFEQSRATYITIR